MLESKAVIGDFDTLQGMQQEKLEMNLTSHPPLRSPASSRRALGDNASWELILALLWGLFVYFSIGSLAILLFMGAAAPETEKEQLEH